jgi:hypothetical protein
VIVVGILASSGGASTSGSIGTVLEVARRAAATGARTEIVGVAPTGRVGDRQLAQLAGAGVGHATVTRSAAAGIEPADLDLALRYLPEVRAVVLVAPPTPLLASAIAAAAWSGAGLVVVGPLDADAAAALDAAGGDPGQIGPTVLDPPARDPDGAFAGVVAALAVRLDAGEGPDSAWRSTLDALAVDRA